MVMVMVMVMVMEGCTQICSFCNSMVMVMVIRWCEKTGKANKKETRYYKDEFRYFTSD